MQTSHVNCNINVIVNINVNANYVNVNINVKCKMCKCNYVNASININVNNINVNTINGNGSGLEFPFNGVSGTQIGGNLGNKDLSPEFTTEYELGFELNLFKNLIGLDVALYSKLTKDQIFSVSIPSATGYSTKTLNAGEISNKGIEVGLDINPFQNPDGFNWNIYTTFSKNVSRVEKLIKD